LEAETGLTTGQVRSGAGALAGIDQVACKKLKEEPTITFEELDRRISEKFGWK
jgi:hypothetical protein